MKQQTAVEWLMISIPRGLVAGFKDAFERAKEIEREQIEDAFDTGTTDDDRIGKEYYNETYGKDYENTNHSS
jgi:hypothetical protein